MNRPAHFRPLFLACAALAAAPAPADPPAAPPPSGAEAQPGEFTIPVERQRLFGITYTAVSRTPLRATIRAVGTVAVETALQWDCVSRLDGYVHELRVSSPGDAVAKGQVLMDVYSPDLLATENEFLDLLRMRDAAVKSGSAVAEQDARRLVASARERMRQWSVSDAQVDSLALTRKASEYLEISSPVDGIVEAIPVRQGRRVAAGDALVSVVGLSEVWVWADFYQEEIPLLRTGTPVSIAVSAYPGAAFAGRIALVDPFINEATRTSRVRVDVANADLRLRPDMYVDVELRLDQGEGLTVPAGAVLPTGRHNIVFVDKGEGRLEPRFVELGRKYGDRYAVIRGLSENERVVSSANFIVDAESKVQGALKSW
jgi:Cu(I)/Ag(I) efflux system membrane fusion protein